MVGPDVVSVIQVGNCPRDFSNAVVPARGETQATHGIIQEATPVSVESACPPEQPRCVLGVRTRPSGAARFLPHTLSQPRSFHPTPNSRRRFATCGLTQRVGGKSRHVNGKVEAIEQWSG
jgi:hypothetical protein